MAFKMNGWNAGAGTGSALKKTSPMKAEPTAAEKAKGQMASEDWQKGKDSAAAHGENLNDLVAKRKTLTKGSEEYNVVQNKINQALGSKKRHTEGAHRSSETDTSSKVVYKDKDAGTKDKIKTKKTSYGSKEKIVSKDDKGTKKTVVKRDEDGNIIGERGYDTTKKDDKKKKKKSSGKSDPFA